MTVIKHEDGMLDLIEVDCVEIDRDETGKLWVNIDGQCRLRIGKTNRLICHDDVKAILRTNKVGGRSYYIERNFAEYSIMFAYGLSEGHTMIEKLRRGERIETPHAYFQDRNYIEPDANT